MSQKNQYFDPVLKHIEASAPGFSHLGGQIQARKSIGWTDIYIWINLFGLPLSRGFILIDITW